MYTVLLVIHSLIAVALIGIILFQRSSTDGLGLSGGSGNNVLSGRGQANLVTRTTAILATLFICTSLALGVVVKNERGAKFTDTVAAAEKEAAQPKAADASPTNNAQTKDNTAKPAAPVVPTGE